MTDPQDVAVPSLPEPCPFCGVSLIPNTNQADHYVKRYGTHFDHPPQGSCIMAGFEVSPIMVEDWNRRAAGRASAKPEGFVYCWLVELRPTFDGHPAFDATYYTGARSTSMGGHTEAMTRDPMKAARYASKEAASEVASTLSHTLSCVWKAIEHGFAAAPTPTASIAPEAEAVTCERCGHENWIMEGKAPCQITEADKRAAPKAEGEAEEVAAFETWAASEGWDVERKGPLNLRESSVNIMWAAWQARARGSAIRPTDPGRERQIGISDDGHEPFWRWIRNAYRDPDALGATFSYWNMQVAFKAGWRAAPVAQAAAGASEEVLRLRQGLWDVYAALGCDTDGDPTPVALVSDIVELVVNAAKEARQDYDDAICAPRPEVDADRASGGE